MRQYQVLADGLAKLQLYLDRWRLTEGGPPFHTKSSWFQPVQYRGESAILKIAMTMEECRGARLMVWWDGNGAARVLAQAENALLLEHASGRQSLLEMVRGGQDDEASRIICHVAARLHARRATPSPDLMPLSSWFEALASAAKVHSGIFESGASIAARLLAEPQDITVLHGDIHHGNILDAGPRGWLAIDPKGLAGERGFDFANIFCNPGFGVATSPGRLARQVEIITEAACLDRHRLLAWIASWAALSAAWHIEDGEKPDTALAIAEIALNELRGNGF